MRQSLLVSQVLTAAIIPLATLASAAGLLVTGLYQDTEWVVPQNRGTDLITLAIVLPSLGTALLKARLGSARATVIWFGLLGYVFYVYAGAALAYALNVLTLIHIALFSLSVFALVAAGLGVDAKRIKNSFDGLLPRTPVVILLGLIALILCGLWFRDIVSFMISGNVPAGIVLADAPTMFVYALDLGIVVPVAVLGAVWLERARPWGYILAGFVLIKAATMGLALLSMTLFAQRAGFATEIVLVVSYLVIAVGSTVMSIVFLRHCRA